MHVSNPGGASIIYGFTVFTNLYTGFMQAAAQAAYHEGLIS